ncbi:MAG: hypothetical protein M3Z92_01130, partial [Bacteroidota bacterium]|nr:hypothetical protein [Bacteroidota bacterium]
MSENNFFSIATTLGRGLKRVIGFSQNIRIISLTEFRQPGYSNFFWLKPFTSALSLSIFTD